jgi:transcriptional regulator with XRE-family HTH domain
MATANDYVPEKRHVRLTPGKSLRIVRELQELTQSELARRTGIAQSAISAFETEAQQMGIKRVKVLAEALGVHPAVIAFPDWEAPFIDLHDRARARPEPVARSGIGVRPVAKVPAKRAAKRARK